MGITTIEESSWYNSLLVVLSTYILQIINIFKMHTKKRKKADKKNRNRILFF